MRLLESAAARIEKRRERCDEELQPPIGGEAFHQSPAVLNGRQRVGGGLMGNADHEEQIELAATVRQGAADGGLQLLIGAGELAVQGA